MSLIYILKIVNTQIVYKDRQYCSSQGYYSFQFRIQSDTERKAITANH